MKARDAALAAVAEGWWVIRLRYRSKRPLEEDWPNRSTADPAEVRRWPADGYNTGIDCRRSGLVLIDLDPPDGPVNLEKIRQGRPLPPTRTVSTARAGGVHLWFRARPDIAVPNSAGRIGPAIDVRGRGGFGIATGSVLDHRAYAHPVRLQNGGQYLTLDPRPPALLPAWLAHAAQPRPQALPRGPVRPVRSPGGYGGSALAGEIERVATAEPGSRNDTLNAAAFRLGQLAADGVLDVALIEASLMSAAQDCGLLADDGQRACERTIASGVSAGLANPRRRAVTG